MASAAIGAAAGMAALMLAVAVFAAVFNTYVVSVAQGLREAAEAASYLSSAAARLENLTVKGSTLEGYIANTGSRVFTIAPGAALVVRYRSGGVDRLEVLPYPDGWRVEATSPGAAGAPGAALALEPGSRARLVAQLSHPPDNSTLVVAVFVSPEGVVARGSTTT